MECHCYLRLPIMDIGKIWDHAAGVAVIEAGGVVTDMEKLDFSKYVHSQRIKGSSFPTVIPR